ncbi:MAG: thiamine-phosphate kinase, partial [Planctomycetota bacterium]
AALFKPPPGELLALTTDTLAEDVHFRTDWMAPDCLGRRALVQGLSDIASMGARPLGAVVALSLPTPAPEDFFDPFLEGLLEGAEEFRAPLAGGNLSRSPMGISVTTTVAGSVHPEAALRRDAAKPGQELWVTGVPGSAAAGLALLEGRREGESGNLLVQRFLRPTPRIEEAVFLRDSAGARAAIDLSDGVRRCATLIAEESDCGLAIDADRLPRDDALDEAVPLLERSAASLALDGGEDFELLFTADADAVDRIAGAFKARFGIPLTRIGRVVEGEGLEILGDPGKKEFKHF